MRRLDWHAYALTAIEKVCRRQKYLCVDDVREILEVVGQDEPPHPNAVGALFNEAVHQGLILKTGQFVQSQRGPAKGRNVQVWQSRLYDSLETVESYKHAHVAGAQGLLL